MGAFALHLGSKLDSVLGRPASSGASAMASEPNCEWLTETALQQMHLPEFPALNSEFGYNLPPLPRLLPKWNQVEWMQSRAISAPTPAANHVAYGAAPSAALGAASGAGVVALAALAFGVAKRRKASRASRARHVLHSPTTPHHAGPSSLTESPPESAGAVRVLMSA